MAEDAEELREKRIEEHNRMMEAARAEEQLKAALRMALEDDAYERLMNVSYANKEFYLKIAQQALAVFRRAGRKLNEEEIILIIRSLKRQVQHETKIEFR